MQTVSEIRSVSNLINYLTSKELLRIFFWKIETFLNEKPYESALEYFKLDLATLKDRLKDREGFSNDLKDIQYIRDELEKQNMFELADKIAGIEKRLGDRIEKLEIFKGQVEIFFEGSKIGPQNYKDFWITNKAKEIFKQTEFKVEEFEKRMDIMNKRINDMFFYIKLLIILVPILVIITNSLDRL